MARWFLLSMLAMSGVSALPLLCAGQPELGDAPRAPKDLTGLPFAGPKPSGVTGGFTVNTASREDVRSFHNAVYTASDGTPMDTTADVSTCTPGTNSATFQESVLRRINWFRAMAGIPASVTLNAAEGAKDQKAAVMMSANNTLSHFPPPTWSCYTSDGANAASNSNLAIGNAGADAITAYIWDFGANNTEVGHRRWILYPQTQVMGTGDVPQTNGFNSANGTWVFDANYGGPRPATRTPYVSWPPAGYAPYQVVFPQWSFALSNADLSAATVTMKSNGVSVAVSLQPYQTGFGENTLVWVPMGLNAASAATSFPFDGMDTVYSVTVTNIKVGLSTTGFSYTVTVFDPAVPGADYHPPTVSGPAHPGVGQDNAYAFTAISNATSYQWQAAAVTAFDFFDGAENGLGNFTADTTPGYSVLDSSQRASGAYSFRLAHPQTSPNPPPDQTLTLNQAFAPKTNGSLTIESELGYAADGETARIQISADGGATWQDIYDQSGVGDGTSGPIESSFVSRSFPLGAFAGSIVQLRFNYTYTPGLNYIYPQGGFPIGWYVDNIAITNAELWTGIVTNATTVTNFVFNPPQAGTFNLQARAFIFTEFPLDWGPALTVDAVTNAAPPVILLSQPLVAGGQVRLDFTVTSGSAATFKLLQADQLGGAWTTNSSAMLTTNGPGAYRFTTSTGPAMRFYRIQTP